MIIIIQDILQGFQAVWQEAVKKEKLDIIFDANITNISRSRLLNKISIERSNKEEDICDFLIWAAPAKEFLRLVSDVGDHEHQLLRL